MIPLHREKDIVKQSMEEEGRTRDGERMEMMFYLFLCGKIGYSLFAILIAYGPVPSAGHLSQSSSLPRERGRYDVVDLPGGLRTHHT